MFLRSGSVYDNADDGMMGYHVIFGFQQANMNIEQDIPRASCISGVGFLPRQLKYQSKQAAGLLVFQ